jgi:hypothetical protein
MKNTANGRAHRRIRGRLFALTLAAGASMNGYAFAQAPVAPVPAGQTAAQSVAPVPAQAPAPAAAAQSPAQPPANGETPATNETAAQGAAAQAGGDGAQGSGSDDSKLTSTPGSKALGISILGNQEAPTSLVIVPWKSSELGNALGNAPMLDDSRQPVDKDVFMRALRYYEIRSEPAGHGGMTTGGRENAAAEGSATPPPAARRR